MPTRKKVYRSDRYAAVKLRQRISQELRSDRPKSMRASYNFFLVQGWIPEKGNGELLGEIGFKHQRQLVKRDIHHGFSDYFIVFLHRAIVTGYKEFYNRGSAPPGYNGMREIARMTGLQETTIRDILILNGAIR